MASSIVNKEDWKLVPPEERGAGGGAKLLGMSILRENPCLFLLEEPPHYYTSAHSHSEPEVIVVLEGRMMFNGAWVEQGAVVHVALMRPASRGKIRLAEEAEAAQ